MTLQELRPGQSARIDRVDARKPGVLRLMTLGLIEGVEVRYQNSAIGGDPMELSVFGTAISVRKQQAGCFQVSPLPANV
jgi:ferrous iron transport protein A